MTRGTKSEQHTIYNSMASKPDLPASSIPVGGTSSLRIRSERVLAFDLRKKGASHVRKNAAGVNRYNIAIE